MGLDIIIRYYSNGFYYVFSTEIVDLLIITKKVLNESI